MTGAMKSAPARIPRAPLVTRPPQAVRNAIRMPSRRALTCAEIPGVLTPCRNPHDRYCDRCRSSEFQHQGEPGFGLVRESPAHSRPRNSASSIIAGAKNSRRILIGRHRPRSAQLRIYREAFAHLDDELLAERTRDVVVALCGHYEGTGATNNIIAIPALDRGGIGAFQNG